MIMRRSNNREPTPLLADADPPNNRPDQRKAIAMQANAEQLTQDVRLNDPTPTQRKSARQRLIAWGNQPFMLELTNATRLVLLACLVVPWLLVAEVGAKLGAAKRNEMSADRMMTRAMLDRSALRVQVSAQAREIERLTLQLNHSEAR